MGEPDKKALAPAKAPPPEGGWTLAFNLVRTDGEEGGETALTWRSRITPLDLALAAAGFLLLVVEPLAVTAVLKRYSIPMLAEACASSQQVVVLHAPQEGPPEHAGGAAPGHEEGGSGDVITPLNVRDPSNLIMRPYVPAADDSWKKALEEAAKAAPERAKEPGT